MELCDKCVFGDSICPHKDTKQIQTKNDKLVACAQFNINPACQLERDMTQALQELVRRGRIKSGRIKRVGTQIMAHTEPPVSDGEIIALMKAGPDVKEKSGD